MSVIVVLSFGCSSAPSGPQDAGTALGSDETVIDTPGGETVTVPALEPGSTGSVEVTVSDVVPVGLPSEAVILSRAVTITLHGAPAFVDGERFEISVPAVASASAAVRAQQAAPESDLFVIASSATDAIAISDQLWEAFGDVRHDEEQNSSVLTVTPGAFEDIAATVGNVPDAGATSVSFQLTLDLPNLFKPDREGLFRVHLGKVDVEAVADAAEDPKGYCEDLVDTSLFEDVERGEASHLATTEPGRVAIVMVHGFQSIGWSPGDDLSKQAHCHAWINTIAAFAHQPGRWADLRAEADLFTVRYDTDDRVIVSASDLADYLRTLQDELGYDDIVILAHSMGGVVSVQARQSVDSEAIRGIVTLGTPHMGAPIVCSVVDEEAPEDDALCLLPGWGGYSDPVPFLAASLSLIAPTDGGLDLTSAYEFADGEPNPYLRRLWKVPGNRENVYAIFGTTEKSLFSGNRNRLHPFRVKYGHHDGFIPASSAAGSSTLQKSGVPYDDSMFDTTVGVARTHGELNSGCDPCWDGRTTPEGRRDYDPYFEEIAKGLLSFTEPEPVAISGTIGGLSAGSWRVGLYDLLSDDFVGASAPVLGSNFSLEAASPATLATLQAPDGVTMAPAATLIGQATLLVFDDADGDEKLDVGAELVHRVNDSENTFPIEADKYVNLMYGDRSYALTGTTSEALTTRFDVGASAGWHRWLYQEGGSGVDVRIHASSGLTDLPLRIGERIDPSPGTTLRLRGSRHGIAHPVVDIDAR